MAKLSENLKRMLIGLAYQDAGEFLSRSEKMKVLNGSSQTQMVAKSSDPRTTQYTARSSSVETGKDETGKVEEKEVTRMVTTKHIAFISNGDGINAPLDYAIESSLRQNAQIDLLVHGAADRLKVAALKKKIHDADVHFQQINIKTNTVESVVNYVVKQPSLIFIITTPSNTVVKTLIEDSLPRPNRIHVPFVLIKDDIDTDTLGQTAA